MDRQHPGRVVDFDHIVAIDVVQGTLPEFGKLVDDASSTVYSGDPTECVVLDLRDSSVYSSVDVADAISRLKGVLSPAFVESLVVVTGQSVLAELYAQNICGRVAADVDCVLCRSPRDIQSELESPPDGLADCVSELESEHDPTQMSPPSMDL